MWSLKIVWRLESLAPWVNAFIIQMWRLEFKSLRTHGKARHVVWAFIVLGQGSYWEMGGARQENPWRLKGQLAWSMQWKNNKETLFSNKVEAKDQHPRWSSHHYTYAVACLCPQLHTQMCITRAHAHTQACYTCMFKLWPANFKENIIETLLHFTYLFYVEEAHAMAHW